MTQYIDGATVVHYPRRIDHRRGEAVAYCGREGEPVDADPSPEDLCASCWSELAETVQNELSDD